MGRGMLMFFFLNDTATTEIYTLSLHDALPTYGADGFLHRFLARRGPGVHHVTFLVPSLAAACARAEAEGYEIVGRDESDSGWMTAFLHPKQALGIVVQLAQSAGREGGRPWEVPPR